MLKKRQRRHQMCSICSYIAVHVQLSVTNANSTTMMVHNQNYPIITNKAVLTITTHYNRSRFKNPSAFFQIKNPKAFITTAAILNNKYLPLSQTSICYISDIIASCGPQKSQSFKRRSRNTTGVEFSQKPEVPLLPQFPSLGIGQGNRSDQLIRQI